MQSLEATQARSATLGKDVAAHPQRYRVLTGERPTGRVHIGHYFGTIAERVRLHKLGVDTLIVLADYQVIADRDSLTGVRDNVYNAVLDYLAAGIDPGSATIFVHSAIPALHQLMLPFLSLVGEAELHRNPTVKAERATSQRELSALLLTYPVHQAADILSCRANLIPVGKDNLPHIEQARTIVRRFTNRYGPLFTLPEPLLTSVPEMIGLDGRKMSKSHANTIALSMTADETAKAIQRTRTDSDRRIYFDTAARPGVSALLTIASLCTGLDERTLATSIGHRGAGALKTLTTDAVNDYFAALRCRRNQLARDPQLVRDVLAAGNRRVNAIAGETLDQVRQLMGTVY